jgi:mannose-6-phosphate isomerase-like protein (cupin superfamily)
VTDKYVGKLIHVNQGQALSLQYHNVKHESMYVVSGEAVIMVDGQSLTVGAGDAVEIPPLTRHRLTAVTDVDVMEVSTPELDDVVRLEDHYGREGTSTP